jgi:hypothetical protein
LRRDFPFRPGPLRVEGFVADVSVAGVSMSDVLVVGALIVGVLAGGVLPGVPGTGCGDEVPAERS